MSVSGTWEVVTNERTHLVVDRANGRCLGGFGSNYYRPWVFPLYSPSGKTVVQEFAFDHPFHNGFFVAQNPIVHSAGVANFWAAPPRRSADDAIFDVAPGRMDVDGDLKTQYLPNGVVFELPLIWRADDETPVLKEVRRVALYADAGGTICEMASEKLAAFGDLRFPQTKFGSIGIRVEPRLLPPMGGSVIADGQRGSADIAHETEARTVAYENIDGLGGHFGVLMTRPDDNAPGPWFVRDYGMALWNPTWAGEMQVSSGATWRTALRVVAYDGCVDDDRASEWASLPARV